MGIVWVRVIFLQAQQFNRDAGKLRRCIAGGEEASSSSSKWLGKPIGTRYFARNACPAWPAGPGQRACLSATRDAAAQLASIEYASTQKCDGHPNSLDAAFAQTVIQGEWPAPECQQDRIYDEHNRGKGQKTAYRDRVEALDQ
jgi:hypothetical protein